MNNDLRPINTIPNFKRFCMTIGELPTSYLETMTYYEMLVWFTEYMKNTIIPTINNNGLAVEELQDKYIELKSYVDNYFTNLDVQQEINNKLDEMAESGLLPDIIDNFLKLNSLLTFNTVTEMKNSVNLVNGAKAKTFGYHNVNDYGNAFYRITNENLNANEENIIALQNGLFAVLEIENRTIRPEQFGCYGNKTNDDTVHLQNCIDYAIANKLNVELTGNYLVNPISQPDNTKVCLKLYRDSSDDSHVFDTNIELYFKRESSIFTNSTEDCTLLRINASNLSITNPYLKGNNDHTILIEMSKINQLNNNETQWSCHNIIRNAKLQYGLRAIAMQGNTYYNTFDKIYINNCKSGIILEMERLEKLGQYQLSSVNRNEFLNVVMTNITTAGVRIEYGDTNKFVNLSFEGVANPIYADDPGLHPTDFPITPKYYSYDNMFINVSIEATSGIPFYNRCRGTKIINTNMKYSKNDFIQQPQVFMGGTDFFSTIEKYGYIFKSLETTKIYDGLPNFTSVDTSASGFGALDFYDYSVSSGTATACKKINTQWTVTDNSNISSITYESVNKASFKKMGGILFIISKFKFVPTDNTANIRLDFPTDLPWAKLNNQFGEFGNVQPLKIPVIVMIGSTNYVTFATIYQTYMIIQKPEINWNTDDNNQVYINTSLIAN